MSFETDYPKGDRENDAERKAKGKVQEHRGPETGHTAAWPRMEGIASTPKNEGRWEGGIPRTAETNTINLTYSDFKVAEDHRNFFVEGRIFRCFYEAYFLVIRPEPNNYYSDCFEVMRNRCNETGFISKSHAILYAYDKPPDQITKEMKAMKAIRIRLDNSSDDIFQVNLAKVYPVEHNMKILSVGMVIPSDLRLLCITYKWLLEDELAMLSGTGSKEEHEILPSLQDHLISRLQPSELVNESLQYSNRMASMHNNEGRREEAKLLEEQATKMGESIFDGKNRGTLISKAIRALECRNQGRWDEAERLYEQVIEKKKERLGTEHPATMVDMSNLAMIYRRQGKWSEAEALCLQVIKTRRRTLGVEHPNTLSSMIILAAIYSVQGRLDEAEELNVEAMETRVTVLGPRHPSTLTSMNNLASVYRSQRQAAKAESLQRHVVKAQEMIFGKEHIDTLSTMNNLANVFRDQGKLAEAVSLQEEVAHKMRMVLGEKHPDTVLSLNNLAIMLADEGKFQEAVLTMRNVLETRRQLLGDKHPDTLSSMENLASILADNGEAKEAESMSRIVLKNREKVLGEKHPDTILTINNVAFILAQQDRLSDAEELLREALGKIKKSAGRDHPNTISIMSNLARVLSSNLQQQTQIPNSVNQQDLAEAKSLFLEAAISCNESSRCLGLSIIRDFANLPIMYPGGQLNAHLAAIRTEFATTLSCSNFQSNDAIFYTIKSDTYHFMKREGLDKSSFQLAITLSGSYRNAQANTCSEYIKWAWPGSCVSIFQVLEEILFAEFFEPRIVVIADMELSIASFGNSEPLKFQLRGSTHVVLDVTEALIWVCAAMRTSESENLSLSKVIFSGKILGKSPHFNISMSDLESITKDQHMCWHPLFLRSVVAFDFPIPTRNDEIGLELPLDLMIHSSGIDVLINHDNKALFVSLKTALIPTSVTHTGSIQWHYLISEDTRKLSSRDIPVSSVKYEILFKKAGVQILK